MALSCLLPQISTPCFAGEKPSAADLSAYEELSQTRLEATRGLLEKDIQALSGRLDTQDKRLDTQNAHIDQSLSLLGTLLTGLGIVLTLAGAAGYVSVQRKAQREAKIASANWFEDHAKELARQIEAVQTRLTQMENQAETHLNTRLDRVKGRADQVDAAMRQIEKGLGEPGKTTPTISAAAAQALDEAARAATNKPESEYTFKDWDSRAYAAYLKGDKEGAARYWREAADSASASAKDSARALFNAGVALGKLHRYDDEIAAYDAVDARFGSDDTPAIREQVAKALVNKGFSLGQMGRHDDAIAAYDALDTRFGSDDAPSLREQVAKALFNKGVALGQIDHDDEIAAYDALDIRFGSDDSPAIREVVASALVNKGVSLGQMSRHDDEIAAYDAVDVRFGSDDTPAIREQVAKALVNKGFSLGQMGRHDDAITAYEAVDVRFGSDNVPAIREQLAKALFNKGVALGQIDHDDEIAAYDAVDVRFGSDDAPAIQKFVAKAKNGKGFKLLCRAKEHWQHPAKRIDDLRLAERLFAEAATILPDSPIVLGNQAYCAHLLEQPVEPLTATLRRALQLGGRSLYEATLDDLSVHPVPERDGPFRTLLDTLWLEVGRPDNTEPAGNVSPQP